MNDLPESKTKPESDGTNYKICTCDALTILVQENLKRLGIKRKDIHTAILQNWGENMGKFPDEVNGKYTIADEKGCLVTISIKSYEVPSFDSQFPHLLVVQNHHKFGNHCLYVMKKYIPIDGDNEGDEVYRCDHDCWRKENKQHNIPAEYPGNKLYRVDVTSSPFEHVDQYTDDNDDDDEMKHENCPSRRPGENENYCDNQDNYQISGTPRKRRTEDDASLNQTTSSKKRFINFHGYIDGTTQIFRAKSGKTDFFRFDIVSKSRDITVVCFDKQRYQEIWNQNNSSNIYMFTNLASKDGDYIMQAETKWEQAVHKRVYEKRLKNTDIGHTTSELKLYRRIHVTAIVYNLYELPPTRDGVKRKLGVIQDESGFNKFMIYGEANMDIREETPYRFKYLWLTSYKGERIVSTTDETKFHAAVGVHFPINYVLSQKRSDVGIQKRIGKVGRFSEDVVKKLCPDCRLEVRAFNAHEEETTYCDNENCLTNILPTDDVVDITYICFRIKVEGEERKQQPLLSCPSLELDKLLNIPGGYNEEVSRVYRTRLINRVVEVTFDVADYEVYEIKIGCLSQIRHCEFTMFTRPLSAPDCPDCRNTLGSE